MKVVQKHVREGIIHTLSWDKNSFVHVLQERAQEQKKLEETQIFPLWMRPINTVLSEYALGTIFGISFIVSLGIFTLCFQWFFSFSQSMVQGVQ